MKPMTQRLLQDLTDMEINLGRNLTDNPNISEANVRYLEVERELFNRMIAYIKETENVDHQKENVISDVSANAKPRIDGNSSRILDRYSKILEANNKQQ